MFSVFLVSIMPFFGWYDANGKYLQSALMIVFRGLQLQFYPFPGSMPTVPGFMRLQVTTTSS